MELMADEADSLLPGFGECAVAIGDMIPTARGVASGVRFSVPYYHTGGQVQGGNGAFYPQALGLHGRQMRPAGNEMNVFARSLKATAYISTHTARTHNGNTHRHLPVVVLGLFASLPYSAGLGLRDNCAL